MRIIKNYLYNILYQILIILLPIVTIPYISRVLGAELIGINAYTNTIVSYFVLLANMGIGLYGSRTISYYRDSKLMASKKFFEIFILKIITGLVSFSLFLLFTMFYGRYKVYLMVQSIQIIATIVDISWFFIGLEDFKKTVLRNAVVKLISVFLIFSFVKTSDNLDLYIFILAFSNLLGQLTLWTHLKSLLVYVKISDLNFIEHLRSIFLLFSSQLTSILFVSLNKILLGNFSDMTQMGYFDQSDRIVRILLALITSISTVIFPKMANSYKKGKFYEVEKLLEISFISVTIISFPIIGGIILVSNQFADLFFGKNFDGIDLTLSVLVIEILFMGWSSIFGGQFLIIIDKVRGINVSLLLAILLDIILAIFLIPKSGSIGAAFISVVCELLIAIVQVFYASKYLNLRKFFISTINDILICILATIGMLISSYLLGSLFSDLNTKIFVQILVSIFSYFSFILLFNKKIRTTIYKFCSKNCHLFNS